jgi:hypothetical protein
MLAYQHTFAKKTERRDVGRKLRKTSASNFYHSPLNRHTELLGGNIFLIIIMTITIGGMNGMDLANQNA